MVCKWSSTRSLSKARSEGAFKETIANAAISASAKAMSVSLRRSSGMDAKPFRTKPKRASAERCFRALGATLDMRTPITSTCNRSRQGVFSHRCLRKARTADPVITGLGGSAGIAATNPFGGVGNPIPTCVILSAGNCTAWGADWVGAPQPSKHFPLNHLLINRLFTTTTMSRMPFHSTYVWLRTITPTAAGLHEHHNKKQNPSYPESLHRTALILRLG